MNAYLRPFVWAALIAALALAWPAFADHHAEAQAPDAPAEHDLADPLATLRPEHPRLFADAAGFERVAQLVQNDPLAAQWYETLKENGEEMLDEPVAEREIRDGRRLLYVSNEVRQRVLTLAMLDRIEPDDRYRDRVWADMQAVAGFEDWNPDHFLDVAVMAYACAIAYDWMYDRWTDEQRAIIREAIVEHGLRPGLRGYERNSWWTRTKINWNQVCNGGLITAALAIADEQPEISAQYIALGVESIKISMARYAPDGGYEEGPGYWSFGTAYNVYAVAALESALGEDFGLGDTPGFDLTGGFPVQMTGPTQLGYNFADGSARPVRAPELLYLAKRYNRPAFAQYAAQHVTGSTFALLWYDPQLVASQANPLPLSFAYQSAGVAVMRSSWDDPGAWFVGAKGGWLDYGHAQMDLGSFILEHDGVRWFADLGLDNYNLPGYFDLEQAGWRWLYYRNRAEGHNTFLINPGGRRGEQPTDAIAPIECVGDQTIRMDLSQVYPGEQTRTITMDTERDRVSVVDEYAMDEPAEAWWFAHTQAQIELAEDGRSAVLTRDGKRLRAALIAPADVRFTVMDARPLPNSPDPEGQNPNNGAEVINGPGRGQRVAIGTLPVYGEPNPAEAYRKLAIHFESITTGRVEVVFEPMD